METALSRPKPVEGRLPFSYNKIKQRNQKTKKIKKKKGGGAKTLGGFYSLSFHCAHLWRYSVGCDTPGSLSIIHRSSCNVPSFPSLYLMMKDYRGCQNICVTTGQCLKVRNLAWRCQNCNFRSDVFGARSEFRVVLLKLHNLSVFLPQLHPSSWHGN